MESIVRFIIRFFVAWILLMAIILIVGDHSGKAGDIVFGSAVFALMIGLFLPLETGSGTEHVHHSRHRKKLLSPA